MEGYRASLILCMPEFDTYNTIKRYAQNNSDPAAVQAYYFLMQRTERLALWHANTQGVGDLGTAMRMYLGLHLDAKPVTMAGMSEDARRKMYEEACKAKGIQLDPETFKKN